jgi:hypothetical protein
MFERQQSFQVSGQVKQADIRPLRDWHDSLENCLCITLHSAKS